MCVSVLVDEKKHWTTPEGVCVCVCVWCVLGAYDCYCNLLSPASHSYYSCRYGAQGFMDTSNETQPGRLPECVSVCVLHICTLVCACACDLLLCVFVIELSAHVKASSTAC